MAKTTIPAGYFAAGSIATADIADNSISIAKLNVSDGSDGQVLTTNGSGTLSFSTISGTTINNNADNRLITGSGTANTLNGEASATFDSNGVLKIFTAGNNANGGNIMLGPSTDDATKYGSITAQQYDSGTETEGFGIIGSRSTSTSQNEVFIGGDLAEVNAATAVLFYTAANATTRGGTERMRIDSAGNVGIGTTADSTRKVHIKDTSANSYRALTIEADSSNADAGLEFIGGGNNVFNIQQPHGSAGLFFYDRTNSATRLTITEDGVVDAAGGLGFKGNAITSCSGFTGTAGHYYWIKPPGATEPVYAEYSGDNYKSRGKGYFAWWKGYGDNVSTAQVGGSIFVNFLNMGFKFYELMVEDLSNYDGNGYPHSVKSYEWAYWSTQQLFNTVGNNATYATSHSFTNGNNVRMMLGNAGGHGLYDTSMNSVCSWGNVATAAGIGSGYDGSCGTYGNGANEQSPTVKSTGITLKLGRPGSGTSASAYFLEPSGADAQFVFWCNF
tara:strand:- start:2379 stop:3884 length:1506 start_codon:yes stop_codon:yes gene_type:complete